MAWSAGTVAYRWLAMALAIIPVAACEQCEQEPVGDSRSAGRARASSVPREPAAPAEVVASDGDGDDGRNWRVIPAFVSDRAHDGAERIGARRVIYRVSLMIPAGLGRAPATIPRPTAELTIDLTEDRLRARFSGNGWPVEEGSEVRIRRDALGAYVFDSSGGRPLGPGQLAAWFQGGSVRRTPVVRIRGPAREEQVGPGALICRLCAEWANQAPEQLARRCGDGGAPPLFRVGPWRAERTADVAVELPRSGLRADHVRPPEPIAQREAWGFLTPRSVRRLEPRYPAPPGRPDAGTGLRIVNDGGARAVVTVGGVPVGWVNPGASLHLSGIRPGVYRIGAMRPSGMAALSARSIRLPGEARIAR